MVSFPGNILNPRDMSGEGLERAVSVPLDGRPPRRTRDPIYDPNEQSAAPHTTLGPFIKCLQKPCDVDLTLYKLQIRKGRGSAVSNDIGDSG